MTFSNQSIGNSPLTTFTAASDTVGGVQYQRVKLTDGRENNTDPLGTSTNPLHITGAVTGSSASSASNGVVSVNNTAGGTLVLAANASRKGGRVRVSMDATEKVFISFGATASASHPKYGPGEVLPLSFGGVPYTGQVTAFVASGTADVEYIEL